MAVHRWPWCRLWLLALCGIAFARAAEAGVPSLYLIQNSGWMEPFYTDPNSPFKPLLRQLAEASHTDRVIVAGFNQDGQVPGHPSPEVAYDGPYQQAAVESAINGIGLASRDRGRLADADFNGALSKGLNVILDAKSSIVWLVTNNKNSPGNSSEIVRNTRDFAEALRNSPFLPYVVAYPVEMRVIGRQYTETGLIIYAIAYGDEAADALRGMVAAAPLRGLFTDPPVKLKHLDQAPLAFTPTGASGSAPVVADVSADGQATLELRGSLRSDYYPQVIDQADLSIAWQRLDGVADVASLPVSVAPARLGRLGPNASQDDVTLVLHTPRLERPAGIRGLFAPPMVLNGQLQLNLSNMSLSLQDAFVARMSKIAALDQLPDVFRDYNKVTAATAVIPVTLVVRYSMVPLILAASLAAATALAGAALIAVALRAREYTVRVGDASRRVRLRPFQSKAFPLPDQRTLVVKGRLLGAHRTQAVARVP